jgi:hypothetical protein
VPNQILGLAEHEAACEELRHHRGVRGLARKGDPLRHPPGNRGRVSYVFEWMSKSSLRASPPVRRASAGRRACARATCRLRGGHRRSCDAVEPVRGRRGRDQRCRGEHARRATQHRSPWHLPQSTRGPVA